MQRPSADEYHPNYQKYFDLIASGDYLDLLRQNSTDTPEFFDYRYAAGKWTIKDVLMHIIDTERVFSYRGLVAARGDDINVPHRMDEELYASNADVSHRTLESLISEFKAVRRATEQLFENTTDIQSRRWCNIGTSPMTARAIAYFIIGHARHHVGVIQEKYL
jgi:uncharacterized damage-inducible protein DinB